VAIGAAVRPPVACVGPGWSATIAATAADGAALGLPAQQVNHASDLGGSEPIWAVPVLPPTSKPGICAAVPVPFSTTPRIASRIVAALCSPIARSHALGL